MFQSTALMVEEVMNGNPASFIGNIPDEYDRGLGPVVFVDYAADMARRVAALAPSNVLEVAAGSGIATRLLRDQLPETTNLTATDLNAPMLDVARRKFRPAEQVHFQVADATSLPFPDRSFDIVACQFGVMFFPDKDKAYREAHRVLVPGGRYLFSVWDSHRHNPYGRISYEVPVRFFPEDPPQFYRVPFAYHSIDTIKQSLFGAGFSDLNIHILITEKAVEDVAALARGVVYGNPLIDEIRRRGTVHPDQIVEALTAALSREFGESRRIKLQAIFFDAGRD